MSPSVSRSSLALAALLSLTGVSRADPPAVDIDGTWSVSGDDAVGRYRGSATFTQTPAGAVDGRATLEYLRWSWSVRRYVPTGRTGVVLIRGRIDNKTLVGVRILPAGLAGLGAPARVDRIRYRVNPRTGTPPAGGSPLSSITGSFPTGAERLSAHHAATPAVDPVTVRLAFKTEVEAAVAGLLVISETDAPFTYRIWEGRAADGASLDAFKRLINLPARPGETRTFEQFTSWRTEHQTGETPEEAAEVEQYRRMVAAFGAHLTDVKVFRIGDEYASLSGGDLLGGILVFIVGRNAAGDLVGLETFVVET